MSFMFKPLEYNDKSAVNHINTSVDYNGDIIVGNESIINEIIKKSLDVYNKNNKCVVLIDGYIGANFQKIINLINQSLSGKKVKYEIFDMKHLYKTSAEIDELNSVKNCLPSASPEDPVCLFGKLFNGSFEDLIDSKKLNDAIDNVKGNCITYFVGNGASSENIIGIKDLLIYMDVTPKTVAIRARKGLYTNIGDTIARPFMELMRRNYYVDYELAVNLRKKLLQNDLIDMYMNVDNDESWTLMNKVAFNGILKELSSRPFRCKPVYLEGIWGGEYIRKVRQLNDIKSKNIAWIFDMIPMEVSVVVEYQKQLLEFPFCTFFMKYPDEVMGHKCKEDFNSYFPIRCNYDDSYHSDGNMSIQVHPYGSFAKTNYGEMGSQDEAYYVIATGHNAKTYVGFNEEADVNEFFNLTHESEIHGTEVDYQKYVNHLDSKPGLQIMLPGGTIHSSGQNQFILELGSLTIGSYTYKIYDYNRKDSNGQLRPIHTINAKKVIDTKRRTNWVKENIAIEPIELTSDNDSKTYQIGKTDLMYYETRRVEIRTNGKTRCENNGQFTILTLVDGESARITDVDDNREYYDQKYLDIIIVPASIKEYEIKNTGYQPIVVHQVMLKN